MLIRHFVEWWSAAPDGHRFSVDNLKRLLRGYWRTFTSWPEHARSPSIKLGGVRSAQFGGPSSQHFARSAQYFVRAAKRIEDT